VATGAEKRQKWHPSRALFSWLTSGNHGESLGKPVSPSDFLIDANMRVVMQGEKRVDFTFLDDDERDLAAKIYKSLLTDHKNISNQPSDDRLSLLAVAKFLASLSSNRGRKLEKLVQEGLERLGIERLARGRGKPKGAEMAHLHAAYVRIVQEYVSDVFRAKGGLRQPQRSKSKTTFRRYLTQERWSQEDMSLFEECSTARSFAINKASAYFQTSPGVIARDCPPVRNSA
jgi:hypothetical protein